MSRESLSDDAVSSNAQPGGLAPNLKRSAIGVVAGVLIVASAAWLLIGMRPAPAFEPSAGIMLSLQACQKATADLGFADVSVVIAGDGASLIVQGDVPTKADIEKVTAAATTAAGSTPITVNVGSAR